MMFKYLLSW